MEQARTAGRIVGALILVQGIGAALVNFGLEQPLFGSPGFLIDAAPHAQQIGLSALLGIALGGIWLGIAVTAHPVFAQRSERLALALVALAGVCLALAVVEQCNVMSMVSLSQSYAKAAIADRAQFETLRGVVAATRNWSHFIGLVLSGFTLFTFYATLYRFTFVPRLLAVIGLAATLSQITSVSLPLFGHGVVFQMLAPLGLCQLVLALWLIVKGFRVDP